MTDGAENKRPRNSEILHLSSASFAIASEVLTLRDISDALGREPDSGWTVGDHIRPSAAMSEVTTTFSQWVLSSGLPAGATLPRQLDALSSRTLEFAGKLAKLDHVESALSIVQHFGRESDLGLRVDARWVSLLGSISGQVDVDQYFWLGERDRVTEDEQHSVGRITSDLARAFKAEFIVESRHLSQAQIATALGQEVDASHQARATKSLVKQRTPHESWSIELTWPSDVHGGTSGLGAALEAMGFEFAERAGQLSAEGCSTSVRATQKISDHSWTTGVHLDPGPVKWMAAAGAGLTIDQRVLSR